MTAAPKARGRGHVLLAAACTVVAVGAGWSAAPIGLGWQLALTAAAVAVLGLPHGAIDHVFARRVLAPRLGRLWPLPFAAAYLALAGAVIAVWLALPAVALAGFLALSAWHFGEEDAAMAPLLPPGRRGFEAAARGMLPILLPVAFHPEETGLLFAWLLLGPSPEAVGGALSAAQGATLPAALALAAGLAAAAAVREAWTAPVEIAFLTAAFAVLPPLLGFALYFCVWHAPRHSLRAVADLYPGRLGDGLAQFAKDAAGLTLATLVFAGIAWRAAGGPDGWSDATVRVLFIGLAALTVPHALLHAVWRPGLAQPSHPGEEPDCRKHGRLGRADI